MSIAEGDDGVGLDLLVALVASFSVKPGACGRASLFSMEARYLIAGPTAASGQEQLYWSSRSGWVSRDAAERFTAEDRKFNQLPPGGRWVEDDR